MIQRTQPKGSLIAGLDIGSHKIACLIGRVIDDDGGVEIIGAGYQASEGIKSGAIVEIERAGHAIRQAIHAAEKMASQIMQGYPLRDITLSVSGTLTHSYHRDIAVNIANQTITQDDIERILSKIQSNTLNDQGNAPRNNMDNQELIHTILTKCAIDGQEGIRSAIGMTGETMEVTAHVMSGDINPLQNMVQCLERSHLDISALCAASYAAGLSSIVSDEMDLGCTLIDMGAGTTSIATFQNGAMTFTDTIPLGGWHVTNDIAAGLSCSHSDAERIKALYGSAIVTDNDDHELIDVPQLGETDQHTTNHISRSLLIGIIQPRLEEIFELVTEKLKNNDLGITPARRVILTGGASQLPSMRELAQTVMNKQVRLGRPIRLSGLPDAVNGPAFSVAAGLLIYQSSKCHEIPAELLSSTQGDSLWDTVKRWWKENW